MHYIGIDLAWTYTKESGICIIDDFGKIVYCEAKVFTDEMITSIVEEYGQDGAIIAIDAPLIVNNEKGSRYCDGADERENLWQESIALHMQ